MCKFMKFRSFIISLILAGFSLTAFAQEAPMTPEQQQKAMREAIDKEITKWEDLLKLEDYQVFYLDSILTHDYGEMQVEMEALQKMRVDNSDYYIAVQDKWMDKIYVAVEKIFTPEQWAKYNKIGAAKMKAERQKRAQKKK